MAQIVYFPFSRVPEAPGREPEAYRKLTGRLTCSFLFYRSSGSSRKVSGRLTGSLLGAVILPGPRKVPEGFRKANRKGTNHLISQTSLSKQSDLGQSAVDLLQAYIYEVGHRLRNILFFTLLCMKLLKSCLGDPGVRFNELEVVPSQRRKQPP